MYVVLWKRSKREDFAANNLIMIYANYIENQILNEFNIFNNFILFIYIIIINFLYLILQNKMSIRYEMQFFFFN